MFKSKILIKFMFILPVTILIAGLVLPPYWLTSLIGSAYEYNGGKSGIERETIKNEATPIIEEQLTSSTDDESAKNPKTILPDDIKNWLELVKNAGAQNSKNNNGQFLITANELGFLEKIELSQKLECLLILSNINKTDREKLFKIVSDGITTVDIKELERIFTENLNNEELERLFKIFNSNFKKLSQ